MFLRPFVFCIAIACSFPEAFAFKRRVRLEANYATTAQPVTDTPGAEAGSPQVEIAAVAVPVGAAQHVSHLAPADRTAAEGPIVAVVVDENESSHQSWANGVRNAGSNRSVSRSFWESMKLPDALALVATMLNFVNLFILINLTSIGQPGHKNVCVIPENKEDCEAAERLFGKFYMHALFALWGCMPMLMKFFCCGAAGTDSLFRRYAIDWESRNSVMCRGRFCHNAFRNMKIFWAMPIYGILLTAFVTKIYFFFFDIDTKDNTRSLEKRYDLAGKHKEKALVTFEFISGFASILLWTGAWLLRDRDYQKRLRALGEVVEGEGSSRICCLCLRSTETEERNREAQANNDGYPGFFRFNGNNSGTAVNPTRVSRLSTRARLSTMPIGIVVPQVGEQPPLVHGTTASRVGDDQIPTANAIAVTVAAQQVV